MAWFYLFVLLPALDIGSYFFLFRPPFQFSRHMPSGQRMALSALSMVQVRVSEALSGDYKATNLDASSSDSSAQSTPERRRWGASPPPRDTDSPPLPSFLARQVEEKQLEYNRRCVLMCNFSFRFFGLGSRIY